MKDGRADGKGLFQRTKTLTEGQGKHKDDVGGKPGMTSGRLELK